MQIFNSPKELQQELSKLDESIGFVPTMGALHDGHKELIRRSKAQNKITVVSIFVNPKQFLESEDLDIYPRTFEQDRALCKDLSVEYILYPKVQDIYRPDEVSLNAPNQRGYILEGATRAGHFSGMLTVVNKLLNIVKPKRAYFGKKDAQQLMLIESMVKDLFMDIEIVAVDTVREHDGLAYSSRNRYLTQDERAIALNIIKSLKLATKLVSSGILDTNTIELQMSQTLAPLLVEYIAFVDREFNHISEIKPGRSIILVEALVAQTRLIDNIMI